jgi:hypothetical protein
MKIELFTVCDFAADYAGKLSVIGVFDTLFSKETPVTHPYWCVAVKFRFEKIEEGQKRLRLSISDADGRAIVPAIDMPIVANVPRDLSSATVNLVLNIGGVKFDRFGEYSIDLAVDGRHEASTPLYVRQSS